MDTIPSSLLAYDLFLEELVVYDTILLPHTINRTYDAIFFFSPSAVESFFSVNYAEPTLFFYWSHDDFSIDEVCQRRAHKNCNTAG